MENTFDIMNNGKVTAFLISLDPESASSLYRDNRKSLQKLFGKHTCRISHEGRWLYKWKILNKLYPMIIYSGRVRGTSYEKITDLSYDEFRNSEVESERIISFLEWLLKKFKEENQHE